MKTNRNTGEFASGSTPLGAVMNTPGQRQPRRAHRRPRRTRRDSARPTQGPDSPSSDPQNPPDQQQVSPNLPGSSPNGRLVEAKGLGELPARPKNPADISNLSPSSVLVPHATSPLPTEVPAGILCDPLRTRGRAALDHRFLGLVAGPSAAGPERTQDGAASSTAAPPLAPE